MELSEKIQKQFSKYPHLKVLFFFDAEKESEEEINQLNISDVRVVKYENNPFNIKVNLVNDWATDKIFLYFQITAPSKQEEFKKFPLLDILIANKELRLGDVSDFMEQYHLQTHQYSLAAKYINELKYNKVQETLKPILNPASFNKENLEKGLISSFLKFNEPQGWDILLARMFAWCIPTYTNDFSRFEKKLQSSGLQEVVVNHINDLTDENITQINQSVLGSILPKVKYNLIIYNLPIAKNDPYGGLFIKHSISSARLVLFFEHIRNQPKISTEFITALLKNSEEIKESVILQYYGVDASFGWMNDQLKWLILGEYIQKISEDHEEAMKGISKLGMHHEENDEIKKLLSACQHAAVCINLIESIESYRLSSPEAYVQKYTTEYYRIDQSFRKAIYKLDSIDDSEIPASVSLEQLRKELNSKYDTWLEKFNREWLSCLQTKNFNYASIGLPKQYDFYKNEVAAFDQKVVVFISDALRYEVAMELLNEMHNDAQSEAEMKFMIASIPSKTSVGMSNLLPGKEREFNDDTIKIDGLSAQTSRQSILQAVKEKSVTVSYAQILRNNQEENRSIFKASVVYIYHDVIDSIGDDVKSERRTFSAVEESISEIKRIVKKIHSSYNVSRVLITADHGFLYNDKIISEADKEDALNGDPIIPHSRFCIFDKPQKPKLGYSFPLSATTLFKDERWVVIPASTNRYKRQGSGKQFVHGGASLQELIVPIIESARRREEITKKVTIKLLTSNPKIVSSILRVEIIQESNVSRYEKGRTIKLGIYNNYDLVSTQAEVDIDSASEFPSERISIVNLSIIKSEVTKSVLTLKIFDIEDSLNPLIEKTVINNTLIQTDF